MSKDEAREVEDLAAEYAAQLHAVQSGIAACIGAGIADDVTPKHLRVGINSALCDSGAIAELLIEKGVFTEVEHLRALVRVATRERESYEKRLSTHYGRDVRLG